MTRIDANVILRFLLADNEEMFKISKEIMHENIYISNEVLAEVIYVLEKFYKFKRGIIFDKLYKLIGLKIFLIMTNNFYLKH